MGNTKLVSLSVLNKAIKQLHDKLIESVDRKIENLLDIKYNETSEELTINSSSVKIDYDSEFETLHIGTSHIGGNY